ncbi:serglycin domain-containing protein [Purpureocillium lavendulum]|uniref:Serglycin domain-containing protein n=1 Tax=Purpureocillium lavendulum TaxID=1247861 RepID=A0AB34FTG1_9HYPO|nr:serglycin domain-containing protein [Purpureocillium lavendulum]
MDFPRKRPSHNVEVPLTKENLADARPESKKAAVRRAVDDVATTLTHSTEPNDAQNSSGSKWAVEVLIRKHRMRSYPAWQFEEQCRREHVRILKARYEQSGRRGFEAPDDMWAAAEESVKSRWVRQGIWRTEWDLVETPSGPWSHELSRAGIRRFESCGAAHTAAGTDLTLTLKDSSQLEQPGPAARVVAERQHPDDAYTEPSRPFAQFMAQVSQLEASWIEDGLPGASDRHVEARDAVRRDWVSQGVWRRIWGEMPGLAWKHEHPLTEILAEDMPWYDLGLDWPGQDSSPPTSLEYESSLEFHGEGDCNVDGASD